jgi:ring-1,2-phenylacetyl-CoA epoxidase subunit PaaB
MDVWDVFGRRTTNDEFVLAGGVKAPDVQMALMLARETHFRHKEGVQYAVRRRGDGGELHVGVDHGDILGGVTDRSYRRQDAYAGVGAKLKRVAEATAERGLRIDRPRPPAHRVRRLTQEQDASHAG